MGPLNLIVPTDTVAGLGEIRGLSPNDGLTLYYRHAGELSKLFDQFAGKVKAKERVAESEVLQAGAAMVSGAPLIMAEIIVLALDGDPADVEGFARNVSQVMRMSAGMQMDALQKIGELTFSSDMPPGKFFGLVLSMAQSATAVMNPRA